MREDARCYSIDGVALRRSIRNVFEFTERQQRQAAREDRERDDEIDA